VNNLDLNEDGQIDYIRVIDNAEGDVHALVLQAVVSETESQDIAVIEIEKNGPQSAILQIIGDEDIFGESLIVEPFEEEGDNGGHGGAMDDYVRVVVNVYGWTLFGLFMPLGTAYGDLPIIMGIIRAGGVPGGQGLLPGFL
jgi:hypothetical protein